MKKILVLTPRFPYPVIGGDRLRIYHLCRALSEHYQLTLLSLCETETEMAMALPDSIFSEVHRVKLPKWRSYINSLMAVPSSIPLQVAYYHSSAYANKLNELLPLHDASLSHLIRVGDYVCDRKGLHVLEMTDAISLNYQRVKSFTRNTSFKAMVYSLEQKRLERYERNIVDGFSFCTLVSDIDREFLYPAKSKNILVCSNGVDTSELTYQFTPIVRDKIVEIVFIGSMTTLQNLDAARWFSTEVMPELVKHYDCKFKIIGRISEVDQRLFNAMDNVISTGGVENVAVSAAGAHIAVCPMRLGAGVQNKVLEYMSLGLPCITSKIGLEGIEAKSGQELLVADTVQEYVDNITRLINDEVLFQGIAIQARQFVEREFSWSSRLAPFVAKFKQLLT